MAAAQLLLGDNSGRDYGRKLQLFNDFAAPELRAALATLAVEPGMRVLDAGCGGGGMLAALLAAVGARGLVVGLDLARAHVAAARQQGGAAAVLQADMLRAPLRAASFDAIWCVNTINHLRDPATGAARLAMLLRPGGRLALGQSSLLPDMYFAWDARLERLTNEAVRRYYRERYRLDERELAPVRAVAGVLQRARLRDVTARTWVIERLAPLAASDEAYLREAIFRDTWGERLRPYLAAADFEELSRLCDPHDEGYALRRPDFHFLQTFTLAVGRA